jgi:hypothetical protein
MEWLFFKNMNMQKTFIKACQQQVDGELRQ